MFLNLVVFMTFGGKKAPTICHRNIWLKTNYQFSDSYQSVGSWNVPLLYGSDLFFPFIKKKCEQPVLDAGNKNKEPLSKKMLF